MRLPKQARKIKNIRMRKAFLASLLLWFMPSFSESKDTGISGRITDEHGRPVRGVVVSNGLNCVKTDRDGRYQLPSDSLAEFVYCTVPADFQVPVHAPADRTADFYRQITPGKSTYDFALKRLPNGKETDYALIVIGDPQVTNAFNPYYEGPNDSLVQKADIARLADETMADIRQTIARDLPKGMPVYAISMGDNVQYYGGYNAALQNSVRKVLGSAPMTVFSVIGNHDQDGRSDYQKKWEEAWGPTDYSFDRGNVHYVCLNNVLFFRGAAYWQPGEITDRQLAWLENDLKLVPADKLVILSYHVPFTFGNRPLQGALPAGKGHYASARLTDILRLLSRFSGYELFCGHTHFAHNSEINLNGVPVLERCHAAVCGNIWQSNVNICGTPNGYYVYRIRNRRINNAYFKAVGHPRNEQMKLFKADADFNKESYAADWNLPKNKGIIVANVFNADSKWRVEAIENGIATPMTRLEAAAVQDAFATGYHHRYAKANPYRFYGKANAYLSKLSHWYSYQPKDTSAIVTVRATDRYGNVFTATTQDLVAAPFFNYAHYYKNKK